MSEIALVPGNPLTRWFAGHRRVADVLVAALSVALLIITQIVLIYDRRHSPGRYEGLRHDDVWGFGLLAIQGSALYWRRTRPIAAFAVSAGAGLSFSFANYPEGALTVVGLIALYSMAAHTDRRTALRWGAVFAVFLALAVTVGIHRGQAHLGMATFISNFVVFGTAWLIGDAVRNRRAISAHLRERAERAEAHRESELRQAVIVERNRIAREMHDSIAHSISVMVVQAAAARRVIDAKPEQAIAAIESIEHTGRVALEEMRNVVGVLRNGENAGERAPQPGIDDIDRLVVQCREAGLPIELSVSGVPPALPPTVGLSLYRIVQESLTNVIKHAGPARARVALRYEPAGVHVEVADDGRGLASVAANGSGHGLLGMRERVDAFGGTLSAGPRSGGGFVVRAYLPIVPVASGHL